MKTIVPTDELHQIIALEHMYSLEDTRGAVYPQPRLIHRLVCRLLKLVL